VFTTGGFYIDRNGVKTSQVNPVTGLKETVAAGKQVTKGVEFEGAWRVTDALTVQASYGYVNAKILYNGSATTDVGQMPAGLPVDQGSLIWTYHFSRGKLKGLSWNSGIVYSGVSYPNSTATDARRTIDAPSYYIVNMGVSYAWRARDQKLSHSIRVSAKNLFDRDYEDQKGGLGAPRGIFFAYTLSH
jgi:iron complex outermembrane receptor protein